MGFKKDFIWGASTAAYQIEGAAGEDGRKDSVWDVFCRTQGNVLHGDSGTVACDHYHRFREDVKHMAALGIKAYRFSIAWPRLIPDGIEQVNPQGAAFYNQLINTLLEHKITPYVTLFHWDYPQALEEKGAWANPESPYWFAAYAKTVATLFGDRVQHFITFNEPQCFLGLGYVQGVHAPGKKLPPSQTVPMAHNIMLAHGLAVQTLRRLVPACKIGYAPCGRVTFPLHETPEDISAAKADYFKVTENNWAGETAWFSDPVMLGEYPHAGLRFLGQYLPPNYREDLKTICQPLDFYAQNLYNGQCITVSGGKPAYVPMPSGHPRTAMNWWVNPEVLYWGPKFLYERYQTPIFITENGMSCHDVISLDGKVHDPNRIDYLTRYLRQLKRVAEDGVNVEGYFVWSLLDNFEWALGYQERFGLIYVDYPTQKRIPKDSFYWYKKTIAENGENL